MKKNLLLFLITLSANLHAVEQTVNWQKQFSEGNYYSGEQHLHYPSIDEDGVIYLIIDGKVNALNSVDGSIIWTNHDVNTTQHSSTGSSINDYFYGSHQLVLGSDNILYTITRKYSPVNNSWKGKNYATYLVSINKFNGEVIDRLLISSLVYNNSYDNINSILFHNNHIIINHYIYFSTFEGKLKFIRNVGQTSYSNFSHTFLGFTDELAIFYKDGHLFAQNRITGLTEWTNHIFGYGNANGSIGKDGNLYFLLGYNLYSVETESGKINYTTQISLDSFLDHDSIINGENNRGWVSGYILNLSNKNIYLRFTHFANDTKDLILKINKYTGDLLAKKGSDEYNYQEGLRHYVRAIYENDNNIGVINRGEVRIYQKIEDLFTNDYDSYPYSLINDGENMFIFNDVNITSFKMQNISINFNKKFASSNYSFPDTSIKYESNELVSIDDNESVYVSTYTPQHTDSSNSENSSGGTDTSNGGRSDYSSDPNYIADFIATNALDYGFAPLVELTSTGATPHTNGWYYQPTWGWMWTSESIFPYVYRSDTEGKTAGWMYFKEGSGSPIYFYSYSDQKWTLLKESTD